MTTRYNVGDAIATFFNSATDVTRDECDLFARDRHGCEPKAVPLQGMCSYTVAAGVNDAHILQFRDENSPLDVKLLTEAKATHPNVVSSIQHLGQLGSSRGLHVYEMERLAGETYILAVDNSLPQPDDSKLRQMMTISDLAMFFAQSWNNAQKLESQVKDDGERQMIAEISLNCGRLIESLPSRFTAKLSTIFKDVPDIVSKLPLVLTHGDLCEMNILIDPDTGHITGVVDWAEARHLPFGLSLWAVENVLGFMSKDGWHYYDNWEDLEMLFWEVFRHAAENLSQEQVDLFPIVRVLGIFLRYGFMAEDNTVTRVVDAADVSRIAYLDVFCLDED